MGVVKLPCKKDYFQTEDHDIWPNHKAVHLTQDKFDYLWRNFHPAFENEWTEEDELNGVDDEDESVTGNDEEPPIAIAAANKPWFHKVECVINHVNKVSQALCRHPGATLSIDEMMKLFKGRSFQTY
jgi:hypothetical protein